MKRRLLFAVNGSPQSAMGIRAKGLARALFDDYELRFVHRPEGGKAHATQRMWREIGHFRPDIIYVLDMAVAGVAAGLLFGLSSRAKLVIDTGDAITALARSAQLRGPLGLAFTWALEESGLRLADRLVVRGRGHVDYLAQRKISATWVPDGYEPELFHPTPKPVDKAGITLGLVGSIVWGGSIESTYGWDLLETLARMPARDWKGIVVGDGSGLTALKAHAERLRLSDRIEFCGRIPYEELPAVLQRMDICLSTQTNDLPGQVRTTGKLPLYLATGRFILASRVGEAARILPPPMLVDYDGSRDLNYPAKLAERLHSLATPGAISDWHDLGLQCSLQHAAQFAYPHLSNRVRDILREL